MSNTPKLRFSEFTKEYDTLELSKFVDRITRKNKDNFTDIPLTISSLDGLVDQRTYFGKPIASRDMSNYYLLEKGEFAYNKSYSHGFPVGSIKRLDNYDYGALSTLYICFALKNDINYNSDYIKYYFESSFWHKKVKEICAEGARNHGLLNVSVNEFFYTKHNITTDIKEQNKIAKLFNIYDQKINNQLKIIENSEKAKDGFLSNLFLQKINVYNNKKSSWKKIKLSDVLKERKEKSSGNEEVFSVSVTKGLVNQIEHMGRSYAADNTSNYNLVYPGDVVYTKSPTGEFKWGIVKQSTINKKVIISPLYGVFIPINNNIGYLIDAYFSSSVRAHNYLITQIRKGAKNTINITNSEFLNKEISLPEDISEQKKIVDIIKLLNKKIEIENKKLEEMKNIKKGLLQKMFC